MVLVGTADLSATLGIPADFSNPRIAECLQQVSEACKSNNKHFGIGGIRNNHQLHGEFMKLGTSFIIAGSDSGYLMQAARADASALQALWHKNS
jgi:4-hydroxy-2-oxoheptanedioate aldolase